MFNFRFWGDEAVLVFNPSLSVCIICRDEAENLARLLPTVTSFADEIVVVDTGSSDQSVTIARRYGAKVIDSPWADDFSAARNTALRHATRTWVLCLDCDDEIPAESMERIQSFIRTTSAEGAYLRYESPVVAHGEQATVVDYKLMLFRNRRHYKFRGRIHETVDESLAERVPLSEIPVSDILIRHHGYEDPCSMKAKYERNLRIIRSMADGEKDHTFLRYCEGVCHIEGLQYEAALASLRPLKSAWSPANPLHSDVLYKLVICLYELGKLDEAQRELSTAIEVYPDFTDLYYFSACIDFQQGYLEEAESKWRHCLEIGESPSCYLHLQGTGTYLAWRGILEICIRQERHRDAVHACLNCLRAKPNDFTRMRQLVMLIADRFDWPDGIRELSRIFDLADPSTICSIASVGEQIGRLEWAYALLTSGLMQKSAERYSCQIARLLNKMID